MKKLVLFTTLLCLTVLVSSCRRDVVESESGAAFGIDVSQYNGDIDWAQVKVQTKTKDSIRFVIIRSSVGVDEDIRYERNYTEAKQQGFVVGSYHYYRPNENSAKQFENFKTVLKLEKGDILPVVDIEAQSSVQSMASLKVGLRNFVTLVEQEYGVKPIIYTSLSMWTTYLQDDFSDCKVWLSAYSPSRRENEVVKNADIHQFTSKIRNIPGIPSKYVDGDDVRQLSSIRY